MGVGMSLLEIGDQFGLETGMVRNQFKRAIQKTGTKSQAQLAVVVVRGIADA
jgi:DNA-binding CsgD family transcriptional regulator